MSKRIYKYLLPDEGESTLRLPRGAELLTAQVQDLRLCLWCIVDPSEEAEPRTFRIYGTGHPLPDDFGTYVASCQAGEFVWHVFEV